MIFDVCRWGDAQRFFYLYICGMSESVVLYNALKAAQEQKKQECINSFYEFVKLMWEVVCAEKFVYNFHIKYLCNVLQEVGERVIERQEALFDVIINIYPGQTKSIIVSQMFDAWLLMRDASIRFLGSSHTHSLAEFNSMMCQEIILSEKFIKIFGKIHLKENMKGKGDFMTIQNGRRKTTSVGTKITGSHFHVIAFDDLVDADKEISTKAIEDAKNHMNKCWSRRVDEKITVYILVMQRVATNDPTPYFHALSTRRVKHIILPATDEFLISPQSLKKFYVNGLMNPNRTSKSFLAKEKKKGITRFNAEYGQSPNDLKGKIVKRTMFVFKKRSDFASNYFATKNKIVADTAYTEQDKNDPSGFLICTYKDYSLYLLDFFEEWLEYPEALDRLAVLYGLYGCDAIHIENKASGKSLAQGIRKMKGLNAIDYEQTKSDKRARLIDKLPMLEAHRVVVVWDDTDTEQIARMEYFITCVTNFPDNSMHDEAVDDLVMAIDLCGQNYTRQYS